jgi:hypothetical protein
MSYNKAVFDLSRPIEDKAPEERSIHKKMSVIPLFADPPVPYPDFLAALDAQDAAVANAQFGGKERISFMRSQEKVVDDMVRKLRTFVTLKADGDKDIILSSGFLCTKPRESSGTPNKVLGVKKLVTDISGAMKLSWNPIKNVGFYEVQIREVEPVKGEPSPIIPIVPTSGGEGADPNAADTLGTVVVERQWIPISTKPSTIEIQDLKPLTYYEVRVRAKGAKAFGGFSDILVVLVI